MTPSDLPVFTQLATSTICNTCTISFRISRQNSTAAVSTLQPTVARPEIQLKLFVTSVQLSVASLYLVLTV